MRPRKLARRSCTLLLSFGAAVVLLPGAASAVTTSTMPTSTTTTRPHSTTTTRPRTTTTTLGAPPSGSCTSISACETALMATLPSPATAKTSKERRIAHHLTRLAQKAVHQLQHATAAKGARQAHLFKQANRTLERMRTKADKAASKGILTVPVAPIDADVAAIVSLDHAG